jgi:hypothetical protein
VKPEPCLYGLHKANSTRRCAADTSEPALPCPTTTVRDRWGELSRKHISVSPITVTQNPVPLDPLTVEKRPIAREAAVMDSP